MQPQERTAYEQIRGYQIDVAAAVKLHDDEADQSHVVGERHPTQDHVVGAVVIDGGGAIRVRDQVLVRQHYALGLAGRAGRELNEREVARRGTVQFARLGDIRDRFHQKRARLQVLKEIGLSGLGGKPAESFERLGVGIQEGLAEFAGDPQQLQSMFIADADRERHGHDAASDGGPETVQELLVVVEENDQLVAIARPQRL